MVLTRPEDDKIFTTFLHRKHPCLADESIL
jgi:hypothetical protein